VAPGPDNPSPKVSIACIAYKHEAYISEALDSVLAQNVDFSIEIVVGDDCSPDSTRDIILLYQNKLPDIIRLNEPRSNMGAGRNVEETIGRCRGEYIALLDGDDYWTSPNKLAAQVALMDAHPEFTMCVHAIAQKWDDSRSPTMILYPPGRRPVYRLADLTEWITPQTSSILFRRSALPGLPQWYFDAPFGDWALAVILAGKGDIGYLDEVMGTYRMHGGGILVGRYQDPQHLVRLLQQRVEAFEIFRTHVASELSPTFGRARTLALYDLAHLYSEMGETGRARDALRAAGYEMRPSRLEPVRVLFHLYAPTPYRLLRGAWRKMAPLARTGRRHLNAPRTTPRA